MEEDRRDKFLLAMYNQMFNDINSHIIVIWQSIAAMIGAFVLFSLVEKNIFSIDIAVALMLVSSNIQTI
jgi:hypothetical protein